MSISGQLALDREDLDERMAAIAGPPLPRAEVEGLVRALGRHIGLPELALDAEGEAELVIAGDVELSLVHLPQLPGIVVAAPIPNVPVARPEYLKIMMQANMSWRLTRGGAFVMLPGRDDVMLCCLIVLSAGENAVERLDRELADIVAYVRFWQAEIDTALAREREAEETAAAVSVGAVRA